MNKRVYDFVKSLKSDAVQLKIEVGERGNSETVGRVNLEREEPEETAREIESLALDAGWSTDHSKLRIYALNDAGKTVGTKQITIKIDARETPKISDVHALTLEFRKGQDALLSCVIEQARIQSKSLDTLSESLAHREFALASVLETMIEAERENAETQAANLFLESALSEPEPEQNAYQSAAGKVLEGLASQFGVGAPADEHPTPPSEEDLKRWYSEDIFFKDAVDNLKPPETPPNEAT